MDNVKSAPDSPVQAPPSSASSLPKEQSQVELELSLLQALEFYPPSKLKGIHRHFVLYGLMEYLRKRWLHYNSSGFTTMRTCGIFG
ncbi:hypothetical protein U9M48_005171 [Paspalum notatum var. saurae]|uniref:Uncharacterized protein n=1 Tax=Paspalum notatum var. saurae TaxID=547442 RepID=A0AAQ3SLQ5_PASNO